MQPSTTIRIFSFYLFLVAFQLIFIPNIFLDMFRIESTTEPWIRVAGILVACLAVYYLQVSRWNYKPFMALTVPVRLFVLAGFTAIWLLKIGPWQLVLFGLIDAAAALWTWAALKRELTVKSL